MIDRPQTRRTALTWLGVVAAASFLTACGSPAQAKGFKVSYTDAEWKKRLTKAQYYILREQGTEPPFSSSLLKEHRKGTFLCA
ncbi:MAG: peptide-methionine (R)-S-oxide reductase, partial [Croceibacterium sp.]